MDLPEPLTEILAIAGVALGLLALGIALIGWRKQRALARAYAQLDPAGGDAIEVLTAQREAVAAERIRIDDLETAITEVNDGLAQTLQHLAVVRYDAFGDMGGRLSFSVAIVDDRGDGVVISAIHARGESRTYAKGIVSGASDLTLTPEEQQALSAARNG